jgi:hypothetical protein
MDFLTNEWVVGILAVVGAAYALARSIVVLTPTPNDDAKLDKVGAILAAIGKLFGLDLTQGYSPGTPKK